MTTDYEYKDTPSIIHREITTVRSGERLKYSDLTAREKRDYLFDEGIRATAYENYKDEKRPDVILGVVRFGRSALKSIANHLLSDTLTRVSDELEEPKPKLFHTYGTTAKIVFIPEPDTPYTGIFSEQAYGLIRFSYAGPVIGVGVVPGLGLKFLVDRDHLSQNMVAMRKLDRQQPFRHFFSKHSHNSVFQNLFTNILPLPRLTNLTMRAVNARFETVNEKGRGLNQSVDNLARVHVNGTPVEEDKVNAPYRLIFRPTKQAIESSDPTVDFRNDLAQNIGAGTTIYDVFALTESQEVDLKKGGVESVEDLLVHGKIIGRLQTESEFIASKYGDYRLFFKHNDRFIQEKFKKKAG